MRDARRLWVSGERVRAEAHNTLYLEHLSAYDLARRFTGEGAVLDVGCGAGFGVAHLAAAARLALGVEIEAAVVAAAARRYRRPGVAFACMDGVRLGVRSSSMDLVTCFQVLEHVPDQRGFLGEIARVLRPTGLALLSTPNALTHRGPRNPFHAHEVTPPELRALLEPHFAFVTLAGQRRPATIYALESACRGVRRWDVLGVRRFVPRPVVSLAVYAIARWKGLQPPQQMPLSSFPITPHTDDAYNLFALCGHGSPPAQGFPPVDRR